MNALISSILSKTFRKRVNPLRVVCPHEDYHDYWVELPTEWTLRHQLLYRAAYNGVYKESEDNGAIAEVAGALALVSDFHFPGIKADLSNLADTPTPILAWLRVEVVGDYISSFNLSPKVEPSS
jgi:hypothetical protein